MSRLSLSAPMDREPNNPRNRRMSVAGGGPEVEGRVPKRRDWPHSDLPARPLNDYNFTIFVNRADTSEAMNNPPIFHEPAVCLQSLGRNPVKLRTRFSARKDWERKSGTANHANEFWWGIGEKGTAELICHLVERYKAKWIIFVAVKDQTTKGAIPQQVLVWRKYRTLGAYQNIDIPKNTSSHRRCPRKMKN